MSDRNFESTQRMRSEIEPAQSLNSLALREECTPFRSTNNDKCSEFQPTTSLHDALESASQGNSILHRMYETAVLAPQGTTNASDFNKVFGTAIATKLNEYGIYRLSRNGQASEVDLVAPLHISDDTGSVDIGKTVDFTSSLDAIGKETLNNIHGVSATSGPFHVAVKSLELQPRVGGYLSANAESDWLEAKICATPKGSISHHTIQALKQL